MGERVPGLGSQVAVHRWPACARALPSSSLAARRCGSRSHRVLISHASILRRLSYQSRLIGFLDFDSANSNGNGHGKRVPLGLFNRTRPLAYGVCPCFWNRLGTRCRPTCVRGVPGYHVWWFLSKAVSLLLINAETGSGNEIGSEIEIDGELTTPALHVEIAIERATGGGIILLNGTETQAAVARTTNIH